VILDSSAVVAVICGESGGDKLVRQIANARSVAIGAPTVAEAQLVLTNKLGKDGIPLLSQFLAEARVLIVPFTREHLSAFTDAFQRYGKGRHPAGLNFGDCFSYAIARTARQPLLFVGDDFSKTDIVAAPKV
jgi:ribonuclease VapC